MGIVVGTVFFQSTGVYSNVFSILFQSVLYQCLGAMVLIVKSFPARSIFYKQQDANFFPTWAYVLGRSLSTVPVAMIDAIG
jgi:ABC-2 type transporter